MKETFLQKLKQRYGIIGNSDGLNRALDIAMQVAPTDLSVLVTGENGSGKEIFPRIIHDNSTRKTKNYFAINCGSIPEGTIDSELFGHEKGAFTGAIAERDGYFGVADGGTLFLDEVGELPLSTQARLLRVLETGEYIRVGASEVRKTNVRIVAATNMNIPKAISEGRFREDLYYRLNTIPIHVPPLRDRGEDVVLLFRKFALEMSEKYNMPPVRLTDAGKQRLMAYRWPGNVRQLRNITENMSITSEVREIGPETLKLYIPQDKDSRELVCVGTSSKGQHSYDLEREFLIQSLFSLRDEIKELKKLVAAQDSKLHEFSHPSDSSLGQVEYIEEDRDVRSMEEINKDSIRQALQQHQGNRKAAAEQLDISERTLYRKIKEYELS